MSSYLLEFGRLHPLLVHFPIGVLIVALVMELATLRAGRAELGGGIRWLVYIGAASSVVAAGFGLLLADGGGYSAPALLAHQWTGIATAAAALGVAWLVRRAERSGARRDFGVFRMALTANVILLTLAGHFGASLSHGEAYLSTLLPWNYEAPPSAEEYDALLLTLAEHRERGPLAEAELNALSGQVRRVFARSCNQCHDADRMEGGLALDSEEGVRQGGDGGAIIVAGRPDGSELMRRLLLPAGHEEAMPLKGRRLLPQEIELIRFWIETGAPWGTQEVRVFPEARLALQKPTPPPARPGVEQPIDRFTDAYFRAHDLRWPERVDDATFIRRVYLDVIGLLPEPAEVEAFLADRSPAKRDRLIDSLLAREDDYAQHWLSFWNDLLRNAYSGPGYITGGRSQITPWLYASLRGNKPYDQLVRELIDPPGEESEGFIRGIRWRGEVNASQTTQMQAAQNVSQALLGLNLKCASCHNSFVSNLTLKQAYSFAAVFSDSILEIERCDVPTGEMAAAGFLYPELGSIDGSLPREERLARLADILVDERNGRLYRTVSNRVWSRLLGRGLVEPVDQMDAEPWSQELLDWLAADLLEHGNDLRYLMSTILRSRTYQLPSVPVREEEASATAGFVFRGPLVKKMSAEQLADAVGRVAAPLYASVAFDPFESPVAPATWIWYDYSKHDRDTFAPPGLYYFRKSFDLPAGKRVAGAELLISVDESFTLFLNGASVARGANWRQVQRLDVRPRLRGGRNVLAIEARGGGTTTVPRLAGVLVNLRILFADGDTLEVRSETDGEWKVLAETPPSGWRSLAFDDAEWEDVRGFGSSVASGTNSRPLNWGQLLAFTHDPANARLRVARASLVQKDPFLTALGYPAREIVTTSREAEPTLLQALELTNGELLNETLERGADRWIAEAGRAPAELVRRVYVTALARPPTAREARVAGEVLGPAPGREAVQDLLWAVVMQPEFQFVR